MRSKRIQVKLPRGFMNVSVTTDNGLVSDTNYSKDFDNIKFPLPKGIWVIEEYLQGNLVILKKRSILHRIKKFLEL